MIQETFKPFLTKKQMSKCTFLFGREFFLRDYNFILMCMMSKSDCLKVFCAPKRESLRMKIGN